jgi:hypothetical protein
MKGDPPVLEDDRSARPDYTTLSVIVPVFNERATVAEIIRRIRQTPQGAG